MGPIRGWRVGLVAGAVVLAVAVIAVAVSVAADSSGGVDPGGTFPAALALSPDGHTLYVGDQDPPGGNGIVRAIDLASGQIGRPIRVSGPPFLLVMTPNGRMLFATDGDVITPIDLPSGTARHPFRTGITPGLPGSPPLLVSRDGRTLYIAGEARIRRYDIASGRFGTDIPADAPAAMLLSRDGRTLWYASADDQLVAVNLATGAVRMRIRVKPYPVALAMTPDGRTLYVAVAGSGGRGDPDEVLPVDTATGTAGPAILTGGDTDCMAMAPDGRTLYVVMEHPGSNGEPSGPGWITPITLATHHARRSIGVGYAPLGAVITPDGSTLYIANQDSGTISVISLNH
jgi:DNA-binding beta-propeller fold protein YncE